MYEELIDIFQRAKGHNQLFRDMLTPVIANAADNHERLYYHHIFEEEEQRMDRLERILPALESFLHKQEQNSFERDYIHLLQNLHLESFGLHNFLEHLELALFHFTDEERSAKLNEMVNESKADYLRLKEILLKMNEEEMLSIGTLSSDLHMVDSIAHDHSHSHHDGNEGEEELREAAPVVLHRKQLTVGSLMNRSNLFGGIS